MQLFYVVTLQYHFMHFILFIGVSQISSISPRDVVAIDGDQGINDSIIYAFSKGMYFK